MKTQHTPLVATILATGLFLAGCVSFTGPNDIRRSITAAAPYELAQEEAVSVGPLGIILAQALVGNMLPFGLGGLESVSFGSYEVRPLSAGASTALPVADLELDGWERIVRVREGDNDLVVMVGADDRTLRRFLVLNREGDRLQIIRIKGNLERIIDEVMEAGWLDLEVGVSTSDGNRDTDGSCDTDADEDADADVNVDVEVNVGWDA